MMTQISIMSQETTQSAGFEKILALLQELIDNNKHDLEANEKTLKNTTLNCETTNASLHLNLNNLNKMLGNYTQQLHNLPSKEAIQKQITNNQKELKIVIANRQEYIDSFQETNKTFHEFIVIYNKVFKLIADCGYSKVKALNEYSKAKSVSAAVLELTVEEYNSCFRKYDDLITKHLSEYDDTPYLTFKTAMAYYLNNSDYDCINGDYLKGMNNTLELNKTIVQFKGYYESKLAFFANYTQQVTLFDKAIQNYRKIISDFQSNIKNYDDIKKDLTKLIEGTNSTIQSVLKTIELTNKDCTTQILNLKEKINIT